MGQPTPRVRPLFRPFDPTSAEAEDQYDTVVRRLNRVRVERGRLRRELQELTREFVEDDLRVRSGPRRGQPLSRAGRRRRLERLVELGSEVRRLEGIEDFAHATLERMNQALDRWARETYGD